MDARSIKVGDLVQVDVRGTVFTATVRSKQPRNIGVDPVDPYHFTWRHVSPRQIVKRLERPEGGA